MSNFVTISGGCHCENIHFSLQWPAPTPEIVSRTCGCAFCRKHGGVWTSHREAQLAIKVNDSALLSKYRFGTGTADFYVCKRCGVVPVVVSQIENRLFAVVNINACETLDAFRLSNKSSDFDGEGTADRLSRRKKNWIPHVDITAPGH